jgi:hypothetical protein
MGRGTLDMARLRRPKPKWVQHIPEGPEPVFAVPEVVPGANCWHGKIDDACDPLTNRENHDRPEYLYRPPRTGCPFTAQELAVGLGLHCAEGRGLIVLREFRDNVCVFFALFAGNSQQAICIKSSDSTKAEPVDVAKRCQDWLVQRTNGKEAGK